MPHDKPSSKLVYVFLWKIENFSLSTCRGDQIIISPSFTIEALSTTKWCLRLYPPKENSNSYIRCFIKRENDEGPESVTLGFDISCITADGQVETVYTSEKNDFKIATSMGSYELWKWKDLLQKRSFYFPEDSFTIRCRLWTCLTEKLVSNTCTALTHIEAVKTSFKKSIYNFSSIFSLHKVTFPVTFSPKLKIAIYLAEATSDYITVDIKKCDESDTDSEMALLVCKLSILDSEGMIRDFKEDRHLFKSKEVDAVWKFQPFIAVQKLKEESILFNDTLNLLFQFSFSTGKSVSRITKCEQPHEMVDDRLSRTDALSTDLERLFAEKKFSDVKLKSGDEILLAHKAILCARSPVFAAMFETNMAENDSGLVDITDMDASTLNKMLIFMYSGNIENMQEKTAIDLLFAADKYQIIPLKEKCSSFLVRNITVKNAIQILVLADLHRDEVLKISAEEFICDHKQELLSSEEWKCFITKHIALASEFLQKLSLRFINA